MPDAGIIYPPGGGGASMVAGASGIVLVGGDPTGATDSTAAIAAAIDQVLNNPGQYGIVSFKAGGVYKMNNQILRTNIPTTTEVWLQGNGCLIDATASTDAAVFDLEGGLGAGDPLNASPVKGALLVSVTTNGQAIAAGDYILISTRAYGSQRYSQNSTVNAGTPGTVTLTANQAFWNNGDTILEKESTRIPFGTTVTAGGGTSTLTLSNNVVGSDAGVVVYHPDQTYLWSPALFNSWRGEIQQVLSVSGGGPYTLNLKTALWDGYDSAKAIVYKMTMPRIVINDMEIKRNLNASSGLIVYYTRDSVLSNLNIHGARDYGIRCGFTVNTRAHDNRIYDNWYNGSGLGYNIFDFSSVHMRIDHNFLEEARSNIDVGGNEPARFITIDHNTVVTAEQATSALDCIACHSNCEYVFVDSNVVTNGGISLELANGAGASVTNNMIYSNKDSGSALVTPRMFGGSVDSVVIDGNQLYCGPNWTAGAISITSSWINSIFDTVTIRDNVVRGVGTAGAYTLITPQNAACTGGVINKLFFIDNDFKDNYAGYQIRCIPSGAANTAILETLFKGGTYEGCNSTLELIHWDPDTNSGAVWFDGVRLKVLGNGSPFTMGSATNNVTDVIISRCKFIAGPGGTNFCIFHNTGTAAIIDTEWNGFNNGSGFYPNSGTPGTDCPRNFYLKNLKRVNVSGAYTPVAGTGWTDDRGMGQTLLVAGDWAASANWGTTPTIVPSGYDSKGTVAITAKATTGAAPTLTLTFKQPYIVVPSVQAELISNVAYGSPSATLPLVAATTTKTTMVLTFNATPTANNIYTFSWLIW